MTNTTPNISYSRPDFFILPLSNNTVCPKCIKLVQFYASNLDNGKLVFYPFKI